MSMPAGAVAALLVYGHARIYQLLLTPSSISLQACPVSTWWAPAARCTSQQ